MGGQKPGSEAPARGHGEPGLDAPATEPPLKGRIPDVAQNPKGWEGEDQGTGGMGPESWNRNRGPESWSRDWQRKFTVSERANILRETNFCSRDTEICSLMFDLRARIKLGLHSQIFTVICRHKLVYWICVCRQGFKPRWPVGSASVS